MLSKFEKLGQKYHIKWLYGLSGIGDLKDSHTHTKEPMQLTALVPRMPQNRHYDVATAGPDFQRRIWEFLLHTFLSTGT